MSLYLFHDIIRFTHLSVLEKEANREKKKDRRGAC
jgi:hypothetical protein